MQIIVNGEPRDVAADLTVAAFVESLGIDRRYVAVELNSEIVPRASHEETRLAEGDRLEIVTMVGGG